MKIFVKSASGEIKVLLNHSVGENLKLRDKFGTTPENTSECLHSKELLISNKLDIDEDDYDPINLKVFRASKLLSMKTKLRKLIQCLVANIRDIDVSLIQKKKDKSQLEWNKISASIRSHIYDPMVPFHLSMRMRSLDSEIFYLDDQMRCKTVLLNFYTDHWRSLMSELEKFGGRKEVERISLGKEVRATDKKLLVLSNNPVKALRESVKEAAAKRFFEDNMVKFRREGSSSSSFQQFMENLASWRAACDEKKWLVNYENDKSPVNTIEGVERAEKARKLVSELPALVNDLKTEVAYWENARKMQIMFQEVPVMVSLCGLSVSPQKREAEQQLTREGKRQKKDVPEGETLHGSKDGTQADIPDGPAVAIPMNEDQVLTEVLTNDDVLGDLVTLDEQEKMRQFCYHSLKLGTGAKEIAQFPGSRPVSLNRENLQLLRQRYYYATWKAGGTRYMMLITSDGCFLIDINFNFRRVQMRFPLKQTNKYLGEDTHNLTLLDGEMVIEASPQKKERRYLIYDLMAINSVSIIERPFSERWKMLEKEVIEPRNLERQSRKFNFRYDLEPFKVKRKEFWLLSATTKLLKVIPMLPHEAHGLIFRGWDDPCVPRTHEGILEWKYPDTNSVDFLFEVDENRQLLYLNELGKKKLMDGNHVDFKNGEVPSELSGRIIECSWNSVEQAWNCMRVSVDKSFPSDINTYMKVMRSIKDNITEEVLLEVIGDIVLLPMYADRMRNDSKARSKQHS